MKGTLLPIAGPKGSGLAMVIDILAGMLSGSHYGPEVKTFHQLEGMTGVGVFCAAINIQYFMDIEEFTVKVDEYIDSVKKLPKVKDVSEIYLPGEIEFNKEAKARKEGFELASSTVEKLNEILVKIGSNSRL